MGRYLFPNKNATPPPPPPPPPEIYVHSLSMLDFPPLQNKCSSRKDKYCSINVWASYTNVTCVILQITFTNGYKLYPQPYFTAHHCINATVWFCLGVSMERMSTSPFFSGPIDTELITMLFANMTIQIMLNLRCIVTTLIPALFKIR